MIVQNTYPTIQPFTIKKINSPSNCYQFQSINHYNNQKLIVSAHLSSRYYLNQSPHHPPMLHSQTQSKLNANFSDGCLNQQEFRSVLKNLSTNQINNRTSNQLPKTQQVFNHKNSSQFCFQISKLPSNSKREFIKSKSTQKRIMSNKILYQNQHKKIGVIRKNKNIKNQNNLTSNNKSQSQKIKCCFCPQKNYSQTDRGLAFREKIINLKHNNKQLNQIMKQSLQADIKQSLCCYNSSIDHWNQFKNKRKRIQQQKQKCLKEDYKKQENLLFEKKNIQLNQSCFRYQLNRPDKLNFYFKSLFEYLDTNKSGTISKFNVCLESLTHNLKYFFGSLLSKIKYKNISYTQQKFINQCQNAILTLQFNQINNIISQIFHLTNKIPNLQIQRSFKIDSESIVMDSLNHEVVNNQSRSHYKGFFNMIQQFKQQFNKELEGNKLMILQIDQNSVQQERQVVIKEKVKNSNKISTKTYEVLQNQLIVNKNYQYHSKEKEKSYGKELIHNFGKKKNSKDNKQLNDQFSNIID